MTHAEGRSGAGRSGLRRVVGLAVVVAATAAAAWGLGLGAGCSHDTKPVVQPDEHPPLPPASGTPIGFLVDDAGELKLSDDQLAKLQAIDQDLAAKLGVLDGEARGPSPTQSSSNQTGTRRRGGRRGGMGGGGRRGGMGGAGAGSGSGSGSSSRPTGGNPARLGQVAEERATDVHTAIDEALAQLDIVQRVIAKRVLADHGVDLDAGRPKAAPAEAEEPGEPGEPDSGSGAGSN